MRLDLLILIRLATVAAKYPGELSKQLKPLVPIDDFKPAFDQCVKALVDAKLIESRPLRVTERGRARAAEALGVDVVPPWQLVRSRYLPALALGVPPNVPGKLADFVIAELLVKHLGLSPRSANPDDIIKLAVTTTLKVPHARAKTLQSALARRWVAEQPALGPTSAPPRVAAVVVPPAATPALVPPPESMPKPTKGWTDEDVIAAVRAATAAVPAAGRFGRDRVFVSAVWRQLEADKRFPGLTFDDLKRRLVAASRREQLTLARADAASAMDSREVVASEIRYLNSTFHFVVDSSRA
jgi:hypothetical protein